jgi:hypothetical protein
MAYGDASEDKIPVLEGKQIVAMVNHEPITAEEFGMFLADIEHETTGSGKKAEAVDYAGILDRLIDEKLFLLEARNIGLDTLPELTTMIDDNTGRTMAKMLVKQEVKNIEVDEEEVEREYKEAVKEFKVTGAVFKTESDARKVGEEVAAGTPFDDIIKKVIGAGNAVEIMEGEYLKKRELMSKVDEVLSQLEIGSISDVVKFQKGFLIVRLDDIRFPQEPELREKISRILWKNAKDIAVEKYIVSLLEKYAEVDQTVLDSIDYDTSDEGYKKLSEDERIVARIKEDKPVTVRDLTAGFEKKLFHGVEQRQKELNKRKEKMLNEMLRKRVLVLEAKKKRIDKSDAYNNTINQFKKSLIVSYFIDKVIAASVKLNEEELSAYYDDHRESYKTPAMMKIYSIVFDEREKAETALAALRSGTEFKWLSEHADGQVRKDAQGLLNFEGTILSVSALPDGVQKVLSEVDSEDFRLYESGDGYFYVLYIEKVFPSTLQEYQEVRNDIAKELYYIKMTEAVKNWSAKLKEHYPVEVYLTEF